MEEDQCSECLSWAGAASMAQDSPTQSCPPASAMALQSNHVRQCVCEHPALCSWICSLQEHQPNTWGFSIAEVSRALFGLLL